MLREEGLGGETAKLASYVEHALAVECFHLGKFGECAAHSSKTQQKIAAEMKHMVNGLGSGNGDLHGRERREVRVRGRHWETWKPVRDG